MARLPIGSCAFVAATLAALSLLGCAHVDRIGAKVTGKDKLQDEVAFLSARVSALSEEKEALENRNQELGERVANLELKLEEIGDEKAEVEEELSDKAARIHVVLFRGDIHYLVDPDAFADFRAGLRMRSLVDPNFSSEFAKFEAGSGGDEEILRILRDIDVTHNRVIDEREARDFRRSLDRELEHSGG